MTDKDHSRPSADAWDELKNPRPMETDFDRVVASALTRRGFLSGVIALGSAAGAMGTLLTTTAARAQAPVFPFEGVDITTDSTIHVPEGYEWKLLARWGDALFSDAAVFRDSTVRSSTRVGACSPNVLSTKPGAVWNTSPPRTHPSVVRAAG